MSARPIPPSSPLTEPYWEAARRGELSLQRCEGCDVRIFPPRAHCPECGGDALRWAPVSGRGTLYSYTVAHRPPHPAFADQLPLVVAIVELEEGPRMVTNLVDCDPSELEVGGAVVARFETIDDSDVALPVFSPSGGRSPSAPS